MKRRERRAGKWTAWVAFLALTAGLAGTAWPASFQGLGDLPGGTVYSNANTVSGDGLVVAGESESGSGLEAFRWTASGGMVGLGSLPAWPMGIAHGASGDGSVVVGSNASATAGEPVRWISGGVIGLGCLPGTIAGAAWAVSGNGSVIVGACWHPDQAFRWTSTTGMVALGFLPGEADSSAQSVSADGSVVVGWSGGQAFRWTQATGMVPLGFLPGGADSWAQGVSADGSVIVGVSGGRAFRWTAATGMVELGNGGAHAASADGSVIVGSGSTGQACIWDAVNGERDLKNLLTSLGVDMDGWTLSFATDVSDDGLTIVGWGTNSLGLQEGWIARGPFEPHIVSNPQPGLIEAGRLTTLTLVDGGSPPYAWYKDDVPLSDNPPRVTGTNTRTLTFSPVQETDEGVYHVTYDDGAKAPAQTPPFYMPVLPEGTLPALGAAGLLLLVGLLLLAGVVLARRGTGRRHDAS